MSDWEALHAEAQADPVGYMLRVTAVRDRAVALRDMHAAEVEGGHPSITEGTRCAVCVGLLQVFAALDSDRVVDTVRAQARLDEVLGAVNALAGR